MGVKLFVATKAFIVQEGKVLILRESIKYVDRADGDINVGTYDVPGGRIEPGQKFDKSLLREIKEETGLEVVVKKPFYVGEWRPVVRGEQWQIVGVYFECEAKLDKVILSEDHDDYRWIEPGDFSKFNLITGLGAAFEAYLELMD